MSIGRGDIYRVDLEPTIGSEQQGAARPCVVLSISAFNKKLRTVVVVPLSSSPRPLPPLVVSVPVGWLGDFDGALRAGAHD